MNKIAKVKICKKCNKEFNSNSNGQRYCDDCRYPECANPECNKEARRNGKYCTSSCAGRHRALLGIIPSQDPIKMKKINKKKKQTMLDRYGVDHNWKDKNIHKKCMKNRENNLLKKYGIRNVSGLDWVQEKRKKTLIKNGNMYSDDFVRHKYGNDWSKISKVVRKRDNYTCQFCGKQNCKLDVHHKIKFQESQDNNRENLITLCVSCHHRIEHMINKVNKKTLEEVKV